MLPIALPRPDGLSFSAYRMPATIAPLWRALEATGIGTPYQRLDWVAPWHASRGEKGTDFAALLATDGSGAPLALLPVEIDRTGPARIARLAGGRHANFGMPWLDRGFARRASPSLAASVLAGLAAAHGGIDIVALVNQPVVRDGIANPFAALPLARPTPEPAFAALIGSHGGGIAEQVISKDSRKKFARKVKWLAEGGPVAHRRATSPGEVATVLDAFLAQKARRSAARQMPNPFADPQVRAFLAGACLSGLDEGRPGIELHALWCGERPVATFGAACDGLWFSGCFIAHDTDPAIERSSPGELLLVEALRDAGRRGFASFDLGVGGGAYKASFCREPIALTDTYQPVTWLGRAAAPVLAGAGKLKAAIKKDPRLVSALRQVGPFLPGRHA